MMWALIAFLFGGSWLLFSRQAGASFFDAFPVPHPAPGTNVNQYDLDTLARTIWGEARGEGYTGMQAVANVVMNRYREAQGNIAKARQYGSTVAEICMKPRQFSAWNVSDPNMAQMTAVTEADEKFRIAQHIAEKAITGGLPDITGGADHYHTASVDPSWSRGKTPVAEIGAHVFYKLA